MTYLAIVIGMINIMTSTYFLAVESSPAIKSFFPTFEIYVMTALLIGIPIVTILGWFHFKKAGTFAAEAAIRLQNNVYSYKWPMGYNQEVFGPAYLTILRVAAKRARSEKLSTEEIEEIENLEARLRHLIDGGHVGNPPSGAFK